ncbi:MAG: DNA gyrase subunit A [Candidatus Gracilibacteria bacterium]|nr:DNA gyrase subunit A [Candidatus Gracilibacteria bacterium]MDD4529958.1 DNA gyrase subunit A [Candidatus Gracilibacteria bacterium]
MSDQENDEILEDSPQEKGLQESLSIVYTGDENKNIINEMEKCYLEYAMSVIVSRALPDVRDGLKPVHRRIVYAMHEGGLRSSSKYRKSARVVGDVMGKYHPHGDSSIYEAMVRMSQDFSMRYPLVDGQGNFGSMDGDSAAAMRYTEAKMDKITDYLIADLEKETVDFRPNYDASTEEPSVMPSILPNLLMNGSLGIAVGMATSIPPHNLTELINALLFINERPNKGEITIEDLMQFVKGPDFPTGGIIYNREDILRAYATGRGSVIMRGKAEITELKNGKSAIVITEVPYQVNKANLVIKIADLVQEKIIIGISDLRDESSKNRVRIVIELKKDSFPKKILNQIYKLTPLQTSFAFNMIALHENGIQPKLFNLLEMLEEFLVHREIVIVRRTTYDLRIAEEKAHILEGLKIAIDNIDEVIKIIKSSKNKDEASINLIERFSFSERQTKAILEMQLQRLANMERQKIEDDLNNLLVLITDLKDILARPERVTQIISDEFKEIKEKFGDERRTLVNPGKIGEFNAKDVIPNEEMIVVITKGGYVKRLKPDSFRTQKRGGKGVSVGLKDEDEIKDILFTSNHNDILFFTSRGRGVKIPVYEIQEASRTAKGQHLANLINLANKEDVATLLDLTEVKGKYLFFITKKATVKRLDVELIKNIRTNGLNLVKIKEDDELGWVKMTSGADNILMVSKNGKAIQFNEEDIRSMGRAASGVRGMRLKGDDEVVEVDIIRDQDKYVFTITGKGVGKISEIEEYREQGRGGSGVKVATIDAKTGKIIGVAILAEEEKAKSQVLLMSKDGQSIRVDLKNIKCIGRGAKGVIIAKLMNKNDVFTSFTIIKEGENEEEDKEIVDENQEKLDV